MYASDYPRWLVFQLVEACNLRCSMCYEWGGAGSHHGHRSTVLGFECIERVVRDCLPGRPFIEFFGGEPFLHPRFADLVELIGASGCALGVPTNGTLIGDFADVLVGDAPIRLWVSLDGPESVNDEQRGRGVFRRALDGIERVRAVRASRGCTFPQLGVTCIVTPLNHRHVARLFLESLDLRDLDFVSIVMQNYATHEECEAYEALLKRDFGGGDARFARGFVETPAHFAGIDCDDLALQITEVREACENAGVLFFTNPVTTDAKNLRAYFSARWSELTDRRSRCAFPWMYAEVSASGDVTTCHALYDLTVGNIHDDPILEIWRNERISAVREKVRRGLLPVCTACCRYFNNPSSTFFAGAVENPGLATGIPANGEEA